MADKTAIEWADATINPIRARRVDHVADPRRRMGWHCEHVSEGCRNCYAEALNRDRFGTGLDYKPGHLVAKGGTVEIELAERALTDMLRWRRPRRIFVCSMTDLFADFVHDRMIDRVFAAMALAPHHTFMLLTKRPERMREYLCARDRPETDSLYRILHQSMSRSTEHAMQIAVDSIYPLPNVWLGVTAEDQTRADERIPVLLATPAAKRFVSVEPMLEAIDLRDIPAGPDIADLLGDDIRQDALGGALMTQTTIVGAGPRLDWVVCGGESGPGARPMHPDWARSLRDQCAATGVPFLFKQYGEWVPLFESDGGWWPADSGSCIRLLPDGTRADDGWPIQRVGKRAAGRLLDGREHLEFPEV